MLCSIIVLSVSALTAAESAGPGWRIVSKVIPADGIGFEVQIEPTDESDRIETEDRRMTVLLRESELVYWSNFKASRGIPRAKINLKDDQEVSKLVDLLRDYDAFSKKLEKHPDPRNARSERDSFAKAAQAYRGALGAVIDPTDTHWRDDLGGAYLAFNEKPGVGTYLAEPTGLYWVISNLSELKQLSKQFALESREQERRQREMALETAKSKNAEGVKAYEQEKRDLQESKAFQQQLLDIQKEVTEAKREVDRKLDQEAETKVRAFVATEKGRDLVNQINALTNKILSHQERNRLDLEKKLHPWAEENSRLWKRMTDPSTTVTEEARLNHKLTANQVEMLKIQNSFPNSSETPFDSQHAGLVTAFEVGSGIKFKVAAPLLQRLALEEAGRRKGGR